MPRGLEASCFGILFALTNGPRTKDKQIASQKEEGDFRNSQNAETSPGATLDVSNTIKGPDLEQMLFLQPKPSFGYSKSSLIREILRLFP